MNVGWFGPNYKIIDLLSEVGRAVLANIASSRMEYGEKSWLIQQ
jgi:hypothetical protein